MAVAHLALSEVIQLLEVEETRGTDFCPVRPSRGPQEPRGHSGTSGGHRTGDSLCVASETFPKRGPRVRVGSPFTPTPEKELLIFLALVGMCGFLF